MSSHLRLVATSIALFALGGLSSSCGGASPDPFAPFRNQTLAWAPCDPTIVDAEVRQILETLGTRATCAWMRAPLDHANPSRGEVSVALLRVAAEVPSVRRGAILFNPGGPGGDGLLLAPVYASLWAGANPLDPVGARYAQLSRAYDLIGFSPRGTGASTRLYCGTNEHAPFVANPSADRSPANVAAMLRTGEMIAQACARNPITPFVNSDATARDMDLVRHLLGDEKVSYYGYSYGTWLGAWYASLFPERVDRMVLTGVMNLPAGMAETFLSQGMGRQRVLDGVLAPYAARNPAVFGMGSDVEAIRRIHRELPMELQEAVAERLEFKNSLSSDDDLLTLRAAQVLAGFLRQRPGATEAEIDALLATTSFQTFDEARTRVLARMLNASTFQKLARPTGPVDLVAGQAMPWVVTCNDEPMGTSLASWVETNDRDAAAHPFVGGRFTMLPCFAWGGPTVTRPPLAAAARAGGILMLQTEMDGLTPVEGAMAAFDAMPGASLIRLNGEDYVHGVTVPYGNACVDAPVADFLLTGTLPPRRTDCAARSLPTRPRPTATFRDPVAAGRLQARLAEIVAGQERTAR